MQGADPNIPVYITGHSLGGALAQIASAVFEGDSIAACYTFGSPKVGNSLFDRWVKPPSYRVINHADIVPLVPLGILYRHAGDPRYLPDGSTDSPYRFEPGQLVRWWQILLGLGQWAWTRHLLGIADHGIEKYIEKLDAIAKSRSQQRN